MSNLLDPTKQKAEVMHMNLADGRFSTLKVDREIDKVVYCKKKNGIPSRFFKPPFARGWVGKITRFLSVEGYPLLVGLDLDDGTKVDMTLEEYLRELWGDLGFENIPQKLKEALNEKLGLIVTVKPIDPSPEDAYKLDELKADAMLYEADLEQTANMGVSKERKDTLQKISEKIPWITVGLALKYVLDDLGIL